jgi:hypothetical protein
MWELPCVPKVQQLIWRLAQNSLSVKWSIERRGIECDTLCVCYRMLDEDGTHLFLRCKKVKKIWRLLELKYTRDQMCTLPSARPWCRRYWKSNLTKQILL